MAPSGSSTRAWLGVLAGVLAIVGVSLWIGGALAARDVADTGDAQDVLSTSSTSTSTSTTVASTRPTTTTTTAAPVQAGEDGRLEPAETGEGVEALQARLNALGYWHGTSDGTYGQLTRQAVMAFQKAEGLPRDGVAGASTLAALATASRPAPRDPSGSHLEIDLARQILMVVQDGRTTWVLNTSTGNGEAYATPGGGTGVATTPTGRFRVEREIDGVREAPLGTLYRPKYFHGGIAVHGSGEIPAQPASHGCVRLTNSAMDLLWSSGVTPIGTPVVVY